MARRAAAAPPPPPPGPPPAAGGAARSTDAPDASAPRRQRLLTAERRAQIDGKLGNQKFVENAPAEVVAEEREKLERLRGELDELG